MEIATAPAIVAFASPNFCPVFVSLPSAVTYKTFDTVAPAPTLTISVAIPALSLLTKEGLHPLVSNHRRRSDHF